MSALPAKQPSGGDEAALEELNRLLLAAKEALAAYTAIVQQIRVLERKLFAEEPTPAP